MTKEEIYKKYELEQYAKGLLTKTNCLKAMQEYAEQYHNNLKYNCELVRVFKCPCDGHKFMLAGEPNGNPTLEEKIEYAEYIASGCTVLIMPIEQFRDEEWKWCSKHSNN